MYNLFEHPDGKNRRSPPDFSYRGEDDYSHRRAEKLSFVIAVALSEHVVREGCYLAPLKAKFAQNNVLQRLQIVDAATSILSIHKEPVRLGLLQRLLQPLF